MTYRVLSYEVDGRDYGTFSSFKKAKFWAENIKWKFESDFSIIKEDSNGNGIEIWTTIKGDLR